MRSHAIEQLARTLRNVLLLRMRNGSFADNGGTRPVRHLRISVDDNLAQVPQQLRRTIPPRLKLKQLRTLIEKRSSRLPRSEGRVVHHVLEERNIRLHAANAKLAQRAIHAITALIEIRSPCAHLHQQRIVKRRDRRTAVSRRAIQSNAKSGRRTVGLQPAIIRDEVVRRILRRNAALDGNAVQRKFFLRRQAHLWAVQPKTLRHLNLRSHKVNPGHHLGHRVLYLNTRIDLNEEPLVGIGIDQKLHRPRVVVARRFRKRDRRVRQFAPDTLRERKCRRNLNHLLMPSLHGAIALIQVQDVAIAIAQNLYFNVLGAPDEPFEKHCIIAERRARLRRRLAQFGGKLSR